MLQPDYIGHIGRLLRAWPNKVDARLIPSGASLVGDSACKGAGVPEGFRFALGAEQNFMPPISPTQQETSTLTQLTWQPIPNAKAYFIAAMSSRNGEDNDMVFWISSELPDNGMGLIDYQTNPAVARWLQEKVLRSTDTTPCSIPKEILGPGAMLRMIAYRSELRLAHPPRPSDPKTPWEPQWAAKVRVKSVANSQLGVPKMISDTASANSGANFAGRDYTGRDYTGRDYTRQAMSGRDYTGHAYTSTKEPSVTDKLLDQLPNQEIRQGPDKLKGLFGF